MKKKVLAVILAAALAAVFTTGCGNSSGSAGTEKTEEAAKETEAVTEEAETVVEGTENALTAEAPVEQPAATATTGETAAAAEQAAEEPHVSYHGYGDDYRTRNQTGQGNRALAAISYLSILFAIPYFLAPNDEFARFHAKQGLKLFVFGIVAEILTSLIGLGWLATLVRLYLIYKGMTNALNGRKEELPYIGNLSIGEK